MKFPGCLLLVILFAAGCSNPPPVPKKVSAHFKANRQKYEYIRAFFSSGSFATVSRAGGKWEFYPEQTRAHDTLLSYFNSLNIFMVQRDSNYLEVHYDHGYTNCYILRYDKHPENFIDVTRKIDSVYVNPRNQYWFIRLDSCWYAERIKCLGI